MYQVKRVHPRPLSGLAFAVWVVGCGGAGGWDEDLPAEGSFTSGPSGVTGGPASAADDASAGNTTPGEGQEDPTAAEGDASTTSTTGEPNEEDNTDPDAGPDPSNGSNPTTNPPDTSGTDGTTDPTDTDTANTGDLPACGATAAECFAASAPIDIIEGADAIDVVVGNFGGSNSLDIATSNNGLSNVSVLLGDGTGVFAGPSVETSSGTGAVRLQTGVLSNDAFTDLVVLNTNDAFTYLISDGTGLFTPTTVDLASGSQPADLAVGEMGNAPGADVAIVTAAGDVLAFVFVQAGAGGTYTADVPVDLARELGGVAIGPVAEDPLLFDVVACGVNVCTAIAGDVTGLNNAQQQGQTQVPQVTDGLRRASPGLFNATNELDLIVLDGDRIVALLGQGGPAGNSAVFTPQLVTTGSDPVEAVSGQVTDDEFADIVVANAGDNTVTVFLGNGAAGFTAFGAIELAAPPTGIATGDLNADDVDDIVVSHAASVTVILATPTP